LRAAIRAFNNLEITYNFREQILLATGHFQTAIEAFDVELRASKFKLGLHHMYHEGLAIDQYWACSLLALCYVYLGEEKLAWRLKPYANRAYAVYNFINKDREGTYDDTIFSIGLVCGILKIVSDINSASNMDTPDFWNFERFLIHITHDYTPVDSL
jgi:hypothetical protein